MSQNTDTVQTYLDGFCRNDHAQILWRRDGAAVDGGGLRDA
jgi:hypothetical protein